MHPVTGGENQSNETSMVENCGVECVIVPDTESSILSMKLLPVRNSLRVHHSGRIPILRIAPQDILQTGIQILIEILNVGRR